jgi:hypothetical protein
MNLSFIASLALTWLLTFTQIQYSELIGTWQLVHFDAMDKLRFSPQYQNANPEGRAAMESKVKYRLENTVYEFVEGDLLRYNDFENQTVVRKEAKIELRDGNMLLIHDQKGDRLAKIIEFSQEKMVLQPISGNSPTGKLVFERIKK